MKKLLPHLVIVLFLFFTTSSSSLAQDIKDGDIGEGYSTPTFRELYTTIAMFGGVDVSNDEVINEYARMIYCDDYTKYFKNDYEWNIRKQVIAKRLKDKEEPYRVLYEIVDTVTLGRYDFNEEFFPVEGAGAIANIGNVQLFDSRMFQEYCSIKEKSDVFPPKINMLLAMPLSITKIKIKKEHMKEISDLMAKYNLTDNRKVYQRVRLRLTDAIGYRYANGTIVSSELEGKVTGVDFFYDKEMTKKIPFIEGYN